MQVQDVDLKLLRVFDTIVRSGGYSAAQSALNLSGSRISEYMSQLETRMGVRLCERGRAGFRLTEDGVQLHDAAQRLLGALDTFHMESSTLRKQLSGVLRFGVIEATLTDDQSPLLPSLRSFMRVAPEVNLQIMMDSPTGMEQRVLDGSLHLALGPFSERVPGLEYKTLYREEQILYCASPHPLYSCPAGLRQDEELRRSRLAARSYLGGQELTLLQIVKAPTTVDNVEGRAMLIFSGNYIGFLPPHYAKPWEQSGLLKRINPGKLRTQLEFKLIWRRGPPPARVVQSFMDHLVSAGQQRERPGSPA